MFLSILRISASNVLKMVLNIVLRLQLLFSILSNQPEAQTRFTVLNWPRYPDRASKLERNILRIIIIKKPSLKQTCTCTTL